jgi:hypothetical protein
LFSRYGDARHAEQETRVYAVVTCLDALAGEDARICPFARGFSPLAFAQDIENSGNDLPRLGFDAARSGYGTNLDALSATRASLDHGVDALGKCSLEALTHVASI